MPSLVTTVVDGIRGRTFHTSWVSLVGTPAAYFLPVWHALSELLGARCGFPATLGSFIGYSLYIYWVLYSSIAL